MGVPMQIGTRILYHRLRGVTYRGTGFCFQPWPLGEQHRSLARNDYTCTGVTLDLLYDLSFVQSSELACVDKACANSDTHIRRHANKSDKTYIINHRSRLGHHKLTRPSIYSCCVMCA